MRGKRINNWDFGGKLWLFFDCLEFLDLSKGGLRVVWRDLSWFGFDFRTLKVVYFANLLPTILNIAACCAWFAVNLLLVTRLFWKRGEEAMLRNRLDYLRLKNLFFILCLLLNGRDPIFIFRIRFLNQMILLLLLILLLFLNQFIKFFAFFIRNILCLSLTLQSLSLSLPHLWFKQLTVTIVQELV